MTTHVLHVVQFELTIKKSGLQRVVGFVLAPSRPRGRFLVPLEGNFLLFLLRSLAAQKVKSSQAGCECVKGCAMQNKV